MIPFNQSSNANVIHRQLQPLVEMATELLAYNVFRTSMNEMMDVVMIRKRSEVWDLGWDRSGQRTGWSLLRCTYGIGILLWDFWNWNARWCVNLEWAMHWVRNIDICCPLKCVFVRIGSSVILYDLLKFDWNRKGINFGPHGIGSFANYKNCMT